MTALIAVALSLAACQQTSVEGVAETVLFAPTPYAGRTIPTTWGTPHQCATFRQSHATGWKGIVGGRKYDFDKSYPVSDAGCFETRQECEAYLTGMTQYVTQQVYRRCDPF